MEHAYTTPAIRHVAVIGTAGRDRNSPLSQSLWLAMCNDVMMRLQMDDHVVSGGAAWADHLAVYAYSNGAVEALTLHLPAPLIRNAHGRVMYQELEGANVKTHAARIANYYHRRFSEIVGYDTLEELFEICQDPYVTVTEEPTSPGMGAFFARNKRIAELANAVLAYTFDEGDAPTSGGTADTWRKLNVDPEHRQHVALSTFVNPRERLLHAKPPAVASTPRNPLTMPITAPRIATTPVVRPSLPATPTSTPSVAVKPVQKIRTAQVAQIRPQFATAVSTASRPRPR